MDVITRRNKINEPCLEDWKRFDKSYMEYMINKNGCRPPHWKMSPNISICTNTKKMEPFSIQPCTCAIKSFMDPCRVIDRIDYTYDEQDLDDPDVSLRNRPGYNLTKNL